MQKLTYDAAFPFSILGENGELVAYCDDDGLSEIERKDTARRIVACMNACADMSTEYLKQCGKMHRNEAGESIAELIQQRDDLLAENKAMRQEITAKFDADYLRRVLATAKVQK